MVRHISHLDLKLFTNSSIIKTAFQLREILSQYIEVIYVSEVVQLRQERVLALHDFMCLKVNGLHRQTFYLLIVLILQALFLQILLPLVSSVFQRGDLFILCSDKLFCISKFYHFAKVCGDTCKHIFLFIRTILQVLDVLFDQFSDKVVLRVFERSYCPATRLQFFLVKQFQVLLQVLIFDAPVCIFICHQLIEQLFVALLLVLDISLVFHGYSKVKHIVANQRLHLHRIEVLLVVEHIALSCLHVFQLRKFDVEQVIELVKVRFHVFNYYASLYLEILSVKTAVKLALHLANLRFILFEGLSVLVEPVLGISDSLLHARFKFLVLLTLFCNQQFHVRDMFLHVLLRAQHYILHLLNVSTALVKLAFESHCYVNLLL